MKQRIKGIDLARALAVIGMIIVNFKVVLGNEGLQWVKSLAGFFDGKAAATFVVLAGVGLALMTNSAIQQNDLEKLRIARMRIAKRALFLFIIGLSYSTLWPADILHFYGVYMVIVIILLQRNGKVLIGSAGGLIFLFPLLIYFWDYETSWDFNTYRIRRFLDFPRILPKPIFQRVSPSHSLGRLYAGRLLVW